MLLSQTPQVSLCTTNYTAFNNTHGHSYMSQEQNNRNAFPPFLPRLNVIVPLRNAPLLPCLNVIAPPRNAPLLPHMNGCRGGGQRGWGGGLTLWRYSKSCTYSIRINRCKCSVILNHNKIF